MRPEGPRFLLLALIAAALVPVACRSAESPSHPRTRAELEEGVASLRRPLTSDLAALYRLRVKESSGLRMHVLTFAGENRMAINEQFGSALSVVAWRTGESPWLYDLREACRVRATGLSEVLGMGRLPLDQAVLLLAGRLPAAGDDLVSVEAENLVRIDGLGWSCRARIEADPWRVMALEGPAEGEPSWRIRLGDHALALPGLIRLEHVDGRWSELDRISVEWGRVQALPPLPELPLCRSDGE